MLLILNVNLWDKILVKQYVLLQKKAGNYFYLLDKYSNGIVTHIFLFPPSLTRVYNNITRLLQ